MLNNLTEKKSKQITEYFITFLKKFFKEVPAIYLSYPMTFYEDDRQNSKYFTIRYFNFDKNSKCFEQNLIEDEDQIFSDNTYLVTWKNEKFELQFFDSPDSNGYLSSLNNFDKERYIFCQITSKRDDDSDKYCVCLGFDIVNMALLELLDVYHTNQNGNTREVEDINKVEKDFIGTKLFDLKL